MSILNDGPISASEASSIASDSENRHNAAAAVLDVLYRSIREAAKDSKFECRFVWGFFRYSNATRESVAKELQSKGFEVSCDVAAIIISWIPK